MSRRASRAALICGTIAAVVTLATVIALWPRAHYFVLALPLFIGMFYSNQIYVGYVPLPMPGFREQVKGLMLGGKSEADAVAEVSRAMEFKAYSSLFITLMTCAIFACVVYDAFSRIDLQFVGPFIGWGAMGVAAFLILLILALLVLLSLAYFRTKRSH
jgi:ascorbate-specific PTS system EIIC-type component UlaA